MSDATPKMLADITTNLQAEYPSATSTIVDQLFRFVRADLSLQDSSAHLKGKLVEFVNGQLGPVEFNPETVYKTIVEECRLRSKYTGTIGSFSDLMAHKSITRDQVVGWLSEIENAHSAPDWSTIVTQLSADDALKLAELAREWKRYRAVALDSGDLSLNMVRDKSVSRLTDAVTLSFRCNNSSTRSMPRSTHLQRPQLHFLGQQGSK